MRTSLQEKQELLTLYFLTELPGSPTHAHKMDHPARKLSKCWNFPTVSHQKLRKAQPSHTHVSEMCFHRSWRKMKALDSRAWQQGLLFPNHTIKECSKTEDQEKATKELWVLWGIKPILFLPHGTICSKKCISHFSTSISNQGT